MLFHRREATADGLPKLNTAGLGCRDGAQVATGTEDHPEFAFGIDTLNINSSGDAAVSYGQFRPTILWDLKTLKELRRVGDDHASAAVFSPDGQSVIIGSETFLNSHFAAKRWRVSDGALLQKLHGGWQTNTGIEAMAFSRDVNHIELLSQKNKLQLMDLTTGEEVYSMDLGADQYLAGAVLSSDGTRAAAIGYRGINLFDFTRPSTYRAFQSRVPAAFAALQRDRRDPAALKTVGEWYAFRRQWKWAAEVLSAWRDGGADVSPLMLARCRWQAGDNAAARGVCRSRSSARKHPKATCGSASGPLTVRLTGAEHAISGSVDECLSLPLRG